MAGPDSDNFAGRLLAGLGPRSDLTDAAAGVSIPAAELPGRIRGAAAALAAGGMAPGDRILLGCSLTPDAAVAYLGALYAGLVAVPVEARNLAAAGPALLERCGARAVWTDASLQLSRWSESGTRRFAGPLRSSPAGEPAAVRRAASDLACLMATSGTTGTPRFVEVTHGNLAANTAAIVRSQRLAADDRAMLILPLSYCFGASVLHSHLWTGGGVVFDRRFMFPDRVLEAAIAQGCTSFAGVPSVYQILLRRSNLRQLRFPALRRWLQAGGRLAPAAIAAMRAAVPTADFYVMYGQTEATSRIACRAAAPDGKDGSVGRPLDNVTVRIVDEHGRSAPPGTTGEILVTGPSVCRGYWNDPEESRRVFTPDGLRTGDWGRMDEAGDLWIEGRQKAFVKMRGIRVSLAEIEEAVTAIPGVWECAAGAADHAEAGQAVVLTVVADPSRPADPAAIRRQLPAHWAVDSIRFVAELPRTASGKVAATAAHSEEPPRADA